MFPSLRLTAAAVGATVAVLICGFGMFASFRVSHEPFARLPQATAPLQLARESAATAPLAFAATEQPDRHAELGELPAFPPTAENPARIPESADKAEAAPRLASTSAEGDAAEATPATSAAPTGGDAATILPPAEATNAEAAHDAEPPQAPTASDEPSRATVLAVVEQPMDQTVDPDAASAADALAPESVAAPSAPAAATAHKDAKKTHRPHVAKVHHIRRAAPVAFADSTFANTPVSGYAQAGLQTPPLPAQYQQFAPRPRPPVRHAKVAAARAKDAKEKKDAKDAKRENKPVKEAKEPNAGTGGPFVSPPSPPSQPAGLGALAAPGAPGPSDQPSGPGK
jgi:hypothetical protein